MSLYRDDQSRSNYRTLTQIHRHLTTGPSETPLLRFPLQNLSKITSILLFFYPNIIFTPRTGAGSRAGARSRPKTNQLRNTAFYSVGVWGCVGCGGLCGWVGGVGSVDSGYVCTHLLTYSLANSLPLNLVSPSC